MNVLLPRLSWRFAETKERIFRSDTDLNKGSKNQAREMSCSIFTILNSHTLKKTHEWRVTSIKYISRKTIDNCKELRDPVAHLKHKTPIYLVIK